MIKKSRASFRIVDTAGSTLTPYHHEERFIRVQEQSSVTESDRNG